MTVTAMAKRLNVSTMTIYRRLKRTGVNIDDLRDEHTQQLTPAGESIIASMFDAPADATATTSDAQNAPQVATGVMSRDDAMSAAVLAAKLEGANALIEQLTNERDALRAQLDALTAALAAEQADRQQERLLLTGGDDLTQNRRRGLFSWMRRR